MEDLSQMTKSQLVDTIEEAKQILLRMEAEEKGVHASQLQTLSENSLRLLKNMAVEAHKGPIGLAMFVGTAIGGLLKSTAPVSAIGQLADSLSEFQKNLAALTQSEQALLLDFLETALGKAV